MRHPKILIGTLFSQVKDYAIRDWFNNVKKFTYPNFDMCMVDNSEDKKYHKKIATYFSGRKKNSKIGKLTILHTPKIDNRSEVFMAFSAQELRKHFLKGDYDYLLNLECDIFPPIDIIERLLSYNKAVISAIYFSGERKRSYPMMMPLLMFNSEKIDVEFPTYPYICGFYQMEDIFQINRIASCGIGCMLLHKNIIEKIPFKVGNLKDEKRHPHYDSFFALDLWNNDIQNFFAPILCRHENQTWDLQFKLIGQR